MAGTPFDLHEWSALDALARISLVGDANWCEVMDLGKLHSRVRKVLDGGEWPERPPHALPCASAMLQQWSRGHLESLKMHPVLWVRWAVSMAGRFSGEALLDQFGRWHDRLLLGGKLPCMQYRKGDDGKWYGERLSKRGGTDGHGKTLATFVLGPHRSADEVLKWRVRLYDARSVANFSEELARGDDSSKARSGRPVAAPPKRDRGSGVSRAVLEALLTLARTRPDIEAGRVTSTQRFAAPTLTREQLYKLILHHPSLSASKVKYVKKTVLAVLSDHVESRRGRPPN